MVLEREHLLEGSICIILSSFDLYFLIKVSFWANNCILANHTNENFKRASSFSRCFKMEAVRLRLIPNHYFIQCRDSKVKIIKAEEERKRNVIDLKASLIVTSPNLSHKPY